jgi:hypothetical protein
MKLIVDGEEMSAFECYRRKIVEEFDGYEYLWLANKGKVYDNALDGVRLPNVPHGLNQFQGYHRCAILSALNPTPEHGRFLQQVVQLTPRQIRRALLSEVAYQAMGRGSMRNPDANEEFVLIVPDKITADDIAKLYPGATIELLMGYDPVPPLRANRYNSDDERRQARLDTFRRANSNRYNNSLSIGICCTPDQIPDSPTNAQPPCHPLIVAEPEYTYSLFGSIMAQKPAMVLSDSTKDAVNLLRSAYDELDRRDLPKPASGLITSAIFREDAPNRTNEYVERNGGMLFFDLDGCDMPREKVADLLDAQCVLCNTASSHTYMNTRLAATLERMRLVVFANANMTPETYEMVGRQIANYLNEKAAAQGYKLGLDPSKLHRGTMMYLPRHAESYMYDPCASFFIDRTVHRQPLDIAPWIEAAQEEMSRIPVYHSPDDAPCDNSDPRYEAAFERWRMRSSGHGNFEFNRLAWSLAARGMHVGQVEQTLKEQASLLQGKSKADRQSQIPYIIRHLKVKGFESTRDLERFGYPT